MSNRPLLIIIGGPNGAGKTTLSTYLIERKRLSRDVTPIINPDEIALTLSIPGQKERGFHAARLALIQRESFLNSRQSFAIETTFSGNSEVNLLSQAKAVGYEIVGYYIILNNIQDSVFRVQDRVKKGGHNVPIKNLFIRYQRSLQNLTENFQQFDRLYLFDNSKSYRSRIAVLEKGELNWINKKHLAHPLVKRLGLEV